MEIGENTEIEPFRKMTKAEEIGLTPNLPHPIQPKTGVTATETTAGSANFRPTTRENQVMTNALLDRNFWRGATLDDLRKQLEMGNDPNENAGTILIWADQYLGLEGCQLVLDHGLDPNSKRGSAETLVSSVICYDGCVNKESVLALLLQYGADPNGVTRNGETNIISVIRGARDELVTQAVRLLLENGASANDYASNGSSALLIAASRRKWDAVRLLVEHGADVTKTDSGGWTALHHATNQQNWDSVRILLNANADPDVKGEYGKTPRDLAKQHGENIDKFRQKSFSPTKH